MSLFNKKQKNNLRTRIVDVDQKNKSKSFSYYSRPRINISRVKKENSPKENNQRVNNDDRVGILKRIPGLIIFFSLIGVFCYFIWLNGKTIVYLSKQNDVFLQSSEIYTKAANDYLNNSISSHTKLSINTKGLDSYIESKFPEVSLSSSSIPPLGNQIRTEIVSSKPFASIEDSNSRIFYLRSDGIVMSAENVKNSELHNNLNLPHIVTKYQSLSVGMIALSSKDLSFVNFVSQEMAAKSQPVVSFTFIPVSRELDVKGTSTSITVKYNLENDPKVQVGSYLALEKYLSNNHITPSSYINLMVTGRAYYK